MVRSPKEWKEYIMGDRLIYSSTPQEARERGSGFDDHLTAHSRHEVKPRESGANGCHVVGSKIRVSQAEQRRSDKKSKNQRWVAVRLNGVADSHTDR
ncbi:hypothetical protein N7507_008335 [Penicillium longicatenatum]|nr:hypothetical protein N7507_008335 [Penicillium longicatenatum]